METAIQFTPPTTVVSILFLFLPIPSCILLKTMLNILCFSRFNNITIFSIQQRWKKRYFKLREGKKLFYAKNNNVSKDRMLLCFWLHLHVFWDPLLRNQYCNNQTYTTSVIIVALKLHKKFLLSNYFFSLSVWCLTPEWFSNNSLISRPWIHLSRYVLLISNIPLKDLNIIIVNFM